MWREDFDTRRYRSMRYVDCYCRKRSNVLVGMKIYPYVNLLGLLVILLFIFVFIASVAPLQYTAGILIFSGVMFMLASSMYKSGKEMMLSAGHTEHCGHRIGLLVMVYTGTYSPFAIMKSSIINNHKEKNNGKTSSIKKPRKRQ